MAPPSNPIVGRVIPAQPTLTNLPPIVQREFEALRKELYRLQSEVEALKGRIAALESQ